MQNVNGVLIPLSCTLAFSNTALQSCYGYRLLVLLYVPAVVTEQNAFVFSFILVNSLCHFKQLYKLNVRRTASLKWSNYYSFIW